MLDDLASLLPAALIAGCASQLTAHADLGTLSPVLAALALTFATEAMAGLQGFEDARFIVIAVAMILVLRLAPDGLTELAGRLHLPGRAAKP